MKAAITFYIVVVCILLILFFIVISNKRGSRDEERLINDAFSNIFRYTRDKGLKSYAHEKYEYVVEVEDDRYYVNLSYNPRTKNFIGAVSERENTNNHFTVESPDYRAVVDIVAKILG